MDGVKDVSIDLNTGRVGVTFQQGRTARPAEMWKAIKDGGYTPVRIETKDRVYEKPPP